MAENQENKDLEQETVEAEKAEAEVTEEAEQVAEEEKEEKKEEKKSASSSKKDKKDEQIDELKDRLMRQMAEFDNYRKRTDKEKKQNYEIGASDFILKILPVVDNFERAMTSMSDEDKASSIGQGVEMIYKQLNKALEDAGVTAIEAAGQEFDPMLHNAVMQQASEEVESGHIIQEFQKGYKYKDRVIRHSMVMVAE